MYAFCCIPIVDGSSPLALAGSFLFSIYKKVIKKFCRQMQTISRSAQKSSKSRDWLSSVSGGQQVYL